jgi:hypothetical protein
MAVAPSEATLRGATPTSSSSIHPELVQAEPYVNAIHVELFYCVITDSEWAFGDDDRKGARRYMLKHAFTYPFLLNEILAISALHLSTRRAAQQSFYREEATRLESQALRLFNETIRDLNQENIIAVFLFSGLQGIATFFETFHPPTYEASEWTFFEKIIHSVRLLQGIRSIVVDWWPFLRTSEIKEVAEEPPTPDPEWSDEVTNQIEAFRVHILQSPGLDQTHATVYSTTIEDLIIVYKQAFGGRAQFSSDDQNIAVKYATRWLILVPPAYTELLVQRRPEALVILGHFAVILHKLKACWAVGDAGQQLVLVVKAHLEESWHAKLSWLKSFIEGD